MKEKDTDELLPVSALARPNHTDETLIDTIL